MSCTTSPKELIAVYRQGYNVQQIIKEPPSEELCSLEKPLFKELQAILKMLGGESRVSFKKGVAKKRIATLANIVTESSKDSKQILRVLSKIRETIGILFGSKKEIVQEHLQTIVELSSQAQPVLESFPMQVKYQLRKRSQEEINCLIENVWAMIATLSTSCKTRNAHYDALSSFNIRMSMVCLAMEKEPERISWKTLEELSLLEELASKAVQNHVNSTCLLLPATEIFGDDSSAKRRKTAPLPILHTERLFDLSLYPTRTYHAPISPYLKATHSLNQTICGSPFPLSFLNGHLPIKTVSIEPKSTVYPSSFPNEIPLCNIQIPTSIKAVKPISILTLYQGSEKSQPSKRGAFHTPFPRISATLSEGTVGTLPPIATTPFRAKRPFAGIQIPTGIKPGKPLSLSLVSQPGSITPEFFSSKNCSAFSKVEKTRSKTHKLHAKRTFMKKNPSQLSSHPAPDFQFSGTNEAFSSLGVAIPQLPFELTLNTELGGRY